VNKPHIYIYIDHEKLLIYIVRLYAFKHNENSENKSAQLTGKNPRTADKNIKSENLQRYHKCFPTSKCYMHIISDLSNHTHHEFRMAVTELQEHTKSVIIRSTHTML
jgi:hypothetical protein